MPKAKFPGRLRCSATFVFIFAIVTAARGNERNAPALSPDEADRHSLTAADSIAPPGLPTMGKWMISADGSIAHWLDEIYEGKRLREPINVVLVDAAAASADDAKQRLVAAAAAAGYPIRFGHSTGYRALIGGQIYAQLPAGRDDAFSNRIFELSNNHGRIFGPSSMDGAYVFIGAFSREEVRFRSPEHGYASFNRARDDFSQNLDRSTQFRLRGFVDMANAIVGDPEITTGDHDGLAVLLRAER
ncbi:MAG TPA: hypothetical protein VFK79_11795 [Xanthobacteraceae bacterium]|nr:hypothetical protein [Xanthobacteraceae bacterium]